MSQPSFDLDFGDAPDPTFTVVELAAEIDRVLRRGFAGGVWVRGEIHGWQERGGHAYFALSDDSGEGKATIQVQLFSNTRGRLAPLLRKHRLRLGDGMKVRIHGFPDFFAPSGRLGFKMDGLDARYTLGELAIARDELIRRLVGEGLYDRNRSLPVALVPLRLGVVASVGSAAWHDFAHELELSGLGFHLHVADVRVQGDRSVRMVSAAIRGLSARAAELALDAIVVIRGGGSRSDLATFDAEPIARAIAGAAVPVLTGLGHEVDRSVADEVAARSLKTPTACAAELIGAVESYRRRTEELWSAVAARSSATGAEADRRLGQLASRIAARTRSTLELASERLDRDAHRVPRAARQAITLQEHRIERAVGRVGGEARRHTGTSTSVIDGIEARVRALDPTATLARGWSITRRTDGSVVRWPGDVGAGDEIVTTVSGGEIRSRVEEMAMSERSEQAGAESGTR